jgi:hypothetical protein
MTARIADPAGHRWPVTGTTCAACRMPTLIPGELHMFCEPPRPLLSPAEHAAALRMLAEALGPVTEVRPLDVWRVSGAPVAAALPTAAPADPVPAAIAAADSEAALTAVWRQHSAAWTDDHTDAARRRLNELEGLPA